MNLQILRSSVQDIRTETLISRSKCNYIRACCSFLPFQLAQVFSYEGGSMMSQCQKTLLEWCN